MSTITIKTKVFTITKRSVLLASLLAICLTGGFIHYHQPISAKSVLAVELAPVIAIGGGVPNELKIVDSQLDQLASKPSIWPTSGEITSPFGWRNSPWGNGRELHPGLDIANSLGTPIVATADGVVAQCGPAGGYGNVVQIDHGNGLTTIYGHNSRFAVSAGQQVKKGQIIAYMGSTGRSTGPHSHYEIRENGTAIDPMAYLIQY